MAGDENVNNGAAQAKPAIRVREPDPFNWVTEEWPAWKSRFLRYRRLSKLDKDDKEVQTDVLLYLMGEKADSAMRTFQFTDPEHRKDVDRIVLKFDEYFGGKVNVIFERAKFNQRSQKSGESAADFITDLYAMAEKCNYGDLKEELIRDRIIVGITNAQLSAAMQMDATITLTKVRERVTQAEEVNKQMPTLRNGHGDAAADVCFTRKAGAGKQRFNRAHKSNPASSPQVKQQPQQQGGKKYPKSCRKCGRSPAHPFIDCPARDSVCSKCQKKGHWAVKCKPGVNEATAEGSYHAEAATSEEMTTYYMDRVEATPRGKALMVNITSNGQPVCWKIDSGADIPIIGYKTADVLKPRDVIEPNCNILLAGKVKVDVVGKCQVQLKWKDKIYDTWAYILPDQDPPLLSRQLSIDMGLITVAPEVMSIAQDQLPENQFPKVFEGLGRMKEEYTITLSDEAKPYEVTQSRRISVPLFKPSKKVIDELLALDAIEEVEEPSRWCAPMVPIPKPDGTVRVTVDYTELNKYVMRESFEMPTVNECLATIGTTARIFSKLDAKWGYWQVPLAKESRHLTTFITPFGRYRWKRMPMGLKSSGEVYKARKVKVLQGLEGVINHVDDDLVWGSTTGEHDQRLRKVLQRYEEAGITLNRSKCQFRVRECDFLGQRVSATGVKAGSKVQDVLDMPVPQDETAVRSFLSSARYYLKFVPNLSELLKPINDMLAGNAIGQWTAAQQKSFEDTKKALADARCLALFDPSLPTRLTADASKYGLGAVLEQQQPSGGWKPIHYASRVLSGTESRYAQVEKEALGATWACEKMSGYLIGLRKFELRTDHKPLTTILGSKPINELSMRLQRFRMRLTPFRYEVTYVPGKVMYAADMLSRLPSALNEGQPDVIEVHSAATSMEIPMAPTVWNAVKKAQEADETSKMLCAAIVEGWPRKPHDAPQAIREYFEHSSKLTILDGVILYNKRVFIPVPMRKEILGKLHQGHLGISRCRSRAQDAVWWPQISTSIAEYVEACPTCKQSRRNPPEPLMPTQTPHRPWETVGMDFAERGRKKFIVVVDYFSTYIELAEVSSTSAAAVLPKLFEIFGRHGVPNVVRSDNGPPFNSHDFAQFASVCGFQHITSSPNAPWSNGKAEAAVKKAKQILEKEPLMHLGLLALRCAPLEEGPSPAQLLMGRRLKTPLPQLEVHLQPQWPDLEGFRRQRQERQAKQEASFNQRHRAKELQPLEQGQRVWVSDRKLFANVTGQADTPRSYHLLTDLGTRIRRNRRDLILAPGASTVAGPGTLQYLGMLQDAVENPEAPRTPRMSPLRVPPPRTPTPRTPPRSPESWTPPGSPPVTPPRPPPKKSTRRSIGRGVTRASSPPPAPGGASLAESRTRRTIRPPAMYGFEDPNLG